MGAKFESTARSRFEESIHVSTQNGVIEGSLAIPEPARGAVIFAHGSGSSRHSPRSRYVAQALHDLGLATLLVDLLTTQEEQLDLVTAEHRFNVELLADRLIAATDWLEINFATHNFRIGYFGASTGAAAALVAASQRPEIAAIVSRGGRPDLAGDALRQVRGAVLLIVGGDDQAVIDRNKEACRELTQAQLRELKIVPGATHLFEEKGALEEVARLAGRWFQHFLRSESSIKAPAFMERSHDASRTNAN